MEVTETLAFRRWLLRRLLLWLLRSIRGNLRLRASLLVVTTIAGVRLATQVELVDKAGDIVFFGGMVILLLFPLAFKHRLWWSEIEQELLTVEQHLIFCLSRITRCRLSLSMIRSLFDY